MAETGLSNATLNSLGNQASGSVFDLLGSDDELEKELERLALENDQLISAFEVGTSPAERAGEQNLREAHSRAVPHPEDSELREQNERLRRRVEELECMIQETNEQAEAMWAEQQKEYEALLEEKSEIIRNLHQENQQLLKGKSIEAAAPELNGDPSELRRELAAMKEEIEFERRRLEEDEDDLMEQARQMEMSMSKERVELARQKNQLQQLYNQIQHEIDNASRDGQLRERLQNLQRRSQECGNFATGAGTPRKAVATQTNLNNTPINEENKSGLLRRLFGQ